MQVSFKSLVLTSTGFNGITSTGETIFVSIEDESLYNIFTSYVWENYQKDPNTLFDWNTFKVLSNAAQALTYSLEIINKELSSCFLRVTPEKTQNIETSLKLKEEYIDVKLSDIPIELVDKKTGKTVPHMEKILNNIRTSFNLDLSKGAELFFEKLLNHESAHSVEDLLEFMAIHDLPITHNGNILTYKYATFKEKENYYVDTHSRKIPQYLGTTVYMEREEVTMDRYTPCSKGLHSGALGYVGGSDNILLTEIDPKNVVSVPYDHSHQKLRSCEYTILADLGNIYKHTSESLTIIKKALLGQLDTQQKDFPKSTVYGGDLKPDLKESSKKDFIKFHQEHFSTKKSKTEEPVEASTKDLDKVIVKKERKEKIAQKRAKITYREQITNLWNKYGEELSDVQIRQIKDITRKTKKGIKHFIPNEKDAKYLIDRINQLK